MNGFWVVLIAVACLAAGILAGWALQMLRGAEERTRLSARASAAEADARNLRDRLAHQDDAHRALMEQARLDQAARQERERQDQSVLRVLAPVQKTLQDMQRKVDTLESDRHTQYGALAEQLRHTNEIEESLRVTTESLAGALRSGTTRGVWGETQLRRVVEAAGLIRHVDFDLQASITSDAGAGRPDMVIHLPGDKALALDAKVPLDAYLEACAIPVTAQGDDAARRTALMGQHVRAVRAHIDALARKGYWEGMTSSPEFVICFLPSESLLAAALDEDPTLLDYAFGKRVALASPVNLWAVLKTVAYTWTQQDVSHEARALFDLGTELYGRLATLADHAENLRRAIERTVVAYNSFAGSLESRVLVSARRFPGIDQTKLDALSEAAVIDKTPKRLTAPEFTDTAAATADLGDVRGRVDDLDARSELRSRE